VAKDSARDEGDVAAIDGVGTQGARGAGAEAPLAKDLAGEVGQQPGAELLVDGAGVEGAEPVPPELLEGDAVDLVGVRAARGDLLPGGACDLLERGKEVAGLREIAIVVDEGAVGVENGGRRGLAGGRSRYWRIPATRKVPGTQPYPPLKATVLPLAAKGAKTWPMGSERSLRPSASFHGRGSVGGAKVLVQSGPAASIWMKDRTHCWSTASE
jgi:hypothetical protein